MPVSVDVAQLRPEFADDGTDVPGLRPEFVPAEPVTVRRRTAAAVTTTAAATDAFSDFLTTPEQRAAFEALDEDERARVEALLEQVARDQLAVAAGTAQWALSFREFVDYVTQGRYLWYRYAEVIASVLQRVADGTLTRVIVCAPPRLGKSEPISKLFPAYVLYRHASWWVGLLSYGAQLAHTFSRAARAHYGTALGYLPGRVAKGVSLWETGHGGGVWAQGARGALLGRGFNVGIIDDPLKNAEEASSETVRTAVWEFYSTTFYSRQEAPLPAAIVVVMQRWHEDDLVGRLLAQEWSAWHDFASGDIDACERWHVVHLPAIAEHPHAIAEYERESGRALYPPSCTVEPDWRQPGEALCPERANTEYLTKLFRRIGPYYTAALYQQRPRASGGSVFPPDSLRTMDPLEWAQLAGDPRVRFCRWWDKAATPGGGDHTAGVLIARVPHTASGVELSRYVVVDVVRGQWHPTQRDEIIRNTCYADWRKYGDRCTFGGEQEGGSAGVTDALFFRRLLDGLPVHTEHPTGSKLTRVTAPGGLSSVAGSGDLYMVRAPWNAAVRREFLDFTGEDGNTDDVVDAAASSYNTLARRRMARRRQDDGSAVFSTLG